MLLLPLVWSEANLANCFEYSRASLCCPSLRRSRYFNLCSLNSRELPLNLSSMCRACAHLRHNKTNNINLSAFTKGMDLILTQLPTSLKLSINTVKPLLKPTISTPIRQPVIKVLMSALISILFTSFKWPEPFKQPPSISLRLAV